MLTRPITYKNLFDNKEETKTFYFNLTALELIELEASFGNQGLVAALNRIVEAEDSEAMIREFKRIIKMTYGVREGDDFVKTPEVQQKFMDHPACSALFMEFFNDNDSLVKFIEGVMPQDVPGKKEEVVNMPPPPTNFEVAKLTDQQMAIGQQIVEGTANG